MSLGDNKRERLILEENLKKFPFLQSDHGVAELEQVEPKIFEIWSRSRKYYFKFFFLQSVWRMLGLSKLIFRLYCYGSTVIEQF